MSAGPCEKPQPGDCVHGNRYHCRDCGGKPVPVPVAAPPPLATLMHGQPVPIGVPAGGLACDECEKPITGPALCSGCHESAVTDACAEAVADFEDAQESAADVIREYASSKKSLGQITPELARALEDCADDLEQVL